MGTATPGLAEDERRGWESWEPGEVYYYYGKRKT